MLRYRFINKNSQFGTTSYSLIIEDLESDPVQYYRIEKHFQDDPDEELLYEAARLEIIRINQSLLNPVPVEEDTESVDG